MVIAALKTLTWGTVAAAVLSAVLLASSGGGLPRAAGGSGETLRSGPRAAASVQPGRADGAANEARQRAATPQGISSH